MAWREALLGLSPDRNPCPGFRPGAWARVQANALDCIERHGAEAHRLGWTAEELFGVHPTLGAIRVGHCGALMLSAAGRVATHASPGGPLGPNAVDMTLRLDDAPASPTGPQQEEQSSLVA